jgi:DNA-binding GntR family transcriptional regulator
MSDTLLFLERGVIKLTLESKKINLNEQVFQTIKEMIINGKLKPGEKLKEVNLAKSLSASRTPVRDALRRLEKESLVNFYPSQGAEVTKLSRETITNLYECRAVLEGLAVRQAVNNVSKESLDLIEDSIYLAKRYYLKGEMDKTVEKNTLFHDKILESSMNIPLIQMMENIRTQILRYRILTSSVGFRPTFIEEHLEIYEAIVDKRMDQAESLMKKHILADLKTVLQGLENVSYLDD